MKINTKKNKELTRNVWVEERLIGIQHTIYDDNGNVARVAKKYIGRDGITIERVEYPQNGKWEMVWSKGFYWIRHMDSSGKDCIRDEADESYFRSGRPSDFA